MYCLETLKILNSAFVKRHVKLKNERKVLSKHIKALNKAA